jgi:hypothetical protein
LAAAVVNADVDVDDPAAVDEVTLLEPEVVRHGIEAS